VSAAQLWLVTLGTVLAALAMAYTLAAAIAARVGRRTPRVHRPTAVPATTILKPLCGAEPALYEQLRSFCEQNTADLQIVFGVRDAHDPALATVQQLRREFPHLDMQVAVDPAQHGTSSKVSNLLNMMPLVRHDYLVIADSDIRVTPDYIERVIPPLLEEGVGIVTCPYHAAPAPGLWSLLGSLFVNEWFMPSVRVAALAGSRAFAFGATIALRRHTLMRVGGFAAIADQLPDDYRLGELTRRLGLRTVLSEVEVETAVHEASFGGLRGGGDYLRPAGSASRQPARRRQRADAHAGRDHGQRTARGKFAAPPIDFLHAAAMAGSLQRPAGVFAVVLELHDAPRALAERALPCGSRWHPASGFMSQRP